MIVGNMPGSMGSLSTTQFCYVIISTVYAIIAIPTAMLVRAVASNIVNAIFLSFTMVHFLRLCLSINPNVLYQVPVCGIWL